MDIRTRLRITEAELAIVQREYSDLLAEKNVLEISVRQYEESWKFAVQELGRVVEQRDDALKRIEQFEKVEKIASQDVRHTRAHTDSFCAYCVTKLALDNCNSRGSGLSCTCGVHRSLPHYEILYNPPKHIDGQWIILYIPTDDNK